MITTSFVHLLVVSVILLSLNLLLSSWWLFAAIIFFVAAEGFYSYMSLPLLNQSEQSEIDRILWRAACWDHSPAVAAEAA